jgi:hypothetical protein
MSQVIGEAEVHISANYDEMMQGFKEVEQKTRTVMSSVSGSVERMSSQSVASMRRMSYGMMQLAYVADDLQYGFRSIVNNIPGLVMGLGGTAGVAGAAAIAAVGVNQLSQHWDDLADRFKASWSGSTIEQLKELRVRAEEAADAFDKLAKTPTEIQGKMGQGLQKAIVEGPIEKVLEGVLFGVQNTEGLAPTPEEAAKTDPWKALASPTHLFKLQEDLARKKAAQILAESKLPGARGDWARQQIATMIRERPETFPEEFRRQFAVNQPEELAAQKRRDEGVKRGQAGAAAQREVDTLIGGEKHKEWQRLHRLAVEKQKHDEKERKDQDAADEKWMREQKRLRAEEARARLQRKHLLDHQDKALGRVREIWKKPFEPEGQQAQFMGLAEFAKFTQTGILNNPVAIQKEQLKRLEEIKEILANNGMMMMNIRGVAVAGMPA